LSNQYDALLLLLQVERIPDWVSRSKGDHVYRGTTPDEAWKQIYAAVEAAREKETGVKTPPLFAAPPPTGAYMFGLNIPAVVRLMELLPGAFSVDC
jgi:hypothetical protein